MEGVDSSNLYKICKGYIHDKANQKEIPYVAVNFKKNPGLLYIYEGIHPKVYQEFREAPSKGQFLNREIIPSAKSTYKSLSVVLGILFLGTTPQKVKEQPKWEKPESGKWCLGYDYKNHRYRYDTSPKTKFQPTKTVIKKAHHSFELYENGNFTKEQAKDLEYYIQSQKSTHDYYPEDIQELIEYYLD